MKNRTLEDRLIDAVVGYGYTHYEASYGHSCIIETCTRADILEMIGDARTEAEAIERVCLELVDPQNERYANACADM